MKSFEFASLRPLQFAVITLLGCPLGLGGCGQNYVKPGANGEPMEITVSAYTQQGCLDNLQEEAQKRNVKVRLKDVQSDLGWEIVTWPFYKGYRCT